MNNTFPIFAHRAVLFGASWNPAYYFNAGAYPGLHFEFEAERYQFPYPPDQAATMTANWTDSHFLMQRSATELDTMIQYFQAALNANAQFAKDGGQYYHERVGRTSGGKRDRLSKEGDMLADGVARANRLFTSALSQIKLILESKSKAQLFLNPDTLVPATNPQTGLVSYSTPAPTPEQVAAQKNPGMIGMAVPLAAIAAAYLVLK